MKEKREVRIYDDNGQPLKSEKINRNSPCKCGSGKKAKICCGVDTKYYFENLRNYTKQ